MGVTKASVFGEMLRQRFAARNPSRVEFAKRLHTFWQQNPAPEERRRRNQKPTESNIKLMIDRWLVGVIPGKLSRPAIVQALNENDKVTIDEWCIKSGEQTRQKDALDVTSHGPAEVRQNDNSMNANVPVLSKAGHHFILEPRYPPEYYTQFRNASSLSIMGSNLSRTYPSQKRELKSVADKGKVRILMLHPKHHACRYAMIQDPGRSNDIEHYRGRIRERLLYFCCLAKKHNSLSIRVMDYVPAFGIDIIEPSRTIWVRLYPLQSKDEPDEDRPIVRLGPQDGTWHGFFKEQFDDHWDQLGKDDFPPTRENLNDLMRHPSDLPHALLKRILDDAGLSESEFRSLL